MLTHPCTGWPIGMTHVVQRLEKVTILHFIHGEGEILGVVIAVSSNNIEHHSPEQLLCLRVGNTRSLIVSNKSS